MIALAQTRIVTPPGIALPARVPVILAMSAAAIVCPVDANEDALVTITVPANSLGPNGMLRVTAQWSMTNNANLKSMRFRYSAIGGSAYAAVSMASVGWFRQQAEIHNRNATNSQVGNDGGGGGWSTGIGQVTSAADTTAATTLVITGQKATAGDVLTLEKYLVELLYGA